MVVSVKDFLTIMRGVSFSGTALTAIAKSNKKFFDNFFMGCYACTEYPIIYPEMGTKGWVWLDTDGSKEGHWCLFVVAYPEGEKKPMFYFYDPAGNNWGAYPQFHKLFGQNVSHWRGRLVDARISKHRQPPKNYSCGLYCLTEAYGFFLRFGKRKHTEKEKRHYDIIRSCATQKDMINAFIEFFSPRVIIDQVVKMMPHKMRKINRTLGGRDKIRKKEKIYRDGRGRRKNVHVWKKRKSKERMSEQTAL